MCVIKRDFAGHGDKSIKMCVTNELELQCIAYRAQGEGESGKVRDFNYIEIYLNQMFTHVQRPARTHTHSRTHK